MIECGYAKAHRIQFIVGRTLNAEELVCQKRKNATRYGSPSRVVPILTRDKELRRGEEMPPKQKESFYGTIREQRLFP